MASLKYIVVLILAIIFSDTSQESSMDLLQNLNNYNNDSSNSSSINNSLSSDFSQLGENEITNLLNYTLYSVQNSSEFQEEGKKHSIFITHRNQYWIEHVAKKLAPLFSVISLWNEKCWTPGYDQGTCYSRKECIDKGGTPSGYCAGGFGVCCSFSYSCDSTTFFNRTYFMNSDFPHSNHEFGTCMHTAAKLVDICQIRLDFEIFELERPEGTGVCVHDKFYIEGIEFAMPPLCGDLTGHHLYLPVGYDSEIKMTMTFSHQNSLRRWKIKTTRLKCNSPMLAPGGCTQYHHGIFGRITSFNYVDEAESNMNKLDYGVCVRREKGFCAVQWSVCGGEKKRRKRSSTYHQNHWNEQSRNPISQNLSLKRSRSNNIGLNQIRVSKRLLETGYDTETEKEKLCRDLARNYSSLHQLNASSSSLLSSNLFLQRLSCPISLSTSSAAAAAVKTTYYSSVADSSWRPFIPPSNYFHQNQESVQTYQDHKHKPQNTSTITSTQPTASTTQKPEKKMNLLVQSGGEYYNNNNNEVNGPISLQPVASDAFEKINVQSSYSGVNYGVYNAKKPHYHQHNLQQKLKVQHKKKPQIFVANQNSSPSPIIVNQAYGPTFRRPISSIQAISPNNYVKLKETNPSTKLVKIKIHKKPTTKQPIISNVVSSSSKPQPSHVKKKHDFIKDLGNKVLAKPAAILSDANLGNKVHQVFAKPGNILASGNLVNKVNVHAKPIITGIKEGVVNKIPVHPKPPSSLSGDKGLIGRVPIQPKPLASTGLKGGLLNKIPVHPKPFGSGGVTTGLLNKIQEKPKPLASQASLLKPGKIKVNPKLPIKGVGLLQPGKVKVKPKIPLKGSGFGLFGRPKVKPKLKYKYPLNLKRPWHKPKVNQTGQCQNKTKLIFVPIPIPLPIPIPIPIVPVVVVPFPFGVDPSGGGGGGGGDPNDPHGHGWGRDGHVISVTEPYLIRIVTDKKREKGLSSFCMDWEQISCDSWHHHPAYLKHEEDEHEHDEEDEDTYYYDDDENNESHEELIADDIEVLDY